MEAKWSYNVCFQFLIVAKLTNNLPKLLFASRFYYLLNYLKSRRANSVEIVSLLTKPSRRKVDIDCKYIGFEVPDEFLVGYGLDYAEKYRNLPFVGVLKREVYEK